MNDEEEQKNESLIDWVSSLNPEWASSALAKYEKRESLDTVKIMSEIKNNFPDKFDSDIDYIFASSLWHAKEKTKPINKNKKIDRTKSMISGFPLTTKDYPWPYDNEGGMAPVCQLNLSDLDLDFIDKFPDVIVQVWCGNDFQCNIRTINISELKEEEIIDDYVDTSNYETISYDYNDKDIIGDYLFCEASKKKFITSSHLDGEQWPLEYSDIKDFSQDDLDKFNSYLEKMSKKHKDKAVFSGFGGEPFCWQTDFLGIYKEGWKPLYKVKNMEGFNGISIFFDGYIALFYRKNKDLFEFKVLQGN